MRAFSGLVAILVSVTVAFAAEISGPRGGRWAHETAKGLAPDPAVTWGRLDNGFRYALLPHAGAPGRVTLQLLVLAGSLDERQDELGIAHFVEHLAFGGTADFPAERMVGLFQRLGVEYGSDVNAITTFDHTAYRLDFRENDPGLLRDGLRLFRGFGDGVNFAPATIEQERRVVLAELRNRNTLADQRQQASLPVVFRGMRFPERGPGGSEALIGKFTREQILGFYRRNYRPDLMVLVGAGDFDAAAMAAEVKAIFGGMARPAEPVTPREDGRLDARGLRAGVFRVPGTSGVAIEAASVTPPATGADSREAQVERQRRRFVMEVFQERLRRDRNGPAGEAAYDELLGHGVAMVSVSGPAASWSDGILAVDQTVRIAVERGLDPGDVEDLKRRRLKLAAHMIEQLPTMDPAGLCEALTESIAEHTVFAGFRAQFDWMREWLERFTAEDARKVLRGLWAPDAMAFHVAGGAPLDLTTEKVLEAVKKARRNGVGHALLRPRRETPFALPKFAAPTEVAERRELPELGAKLLRFGNNVRLNFIAGQREPGLAHVVVRVGTGLLEMPGNKPALKEFGLNTLLASGSTHFRPERINALIEDRFLEFGFDVADRDAFTFRGVMAAEEVEVFLGLVADILHAPQFNSYAHQDQRMQAALGRMAMSMGMGEGMRGLTNHLFKGDPRFTWGAPLDYVSMSVLDVRRWMEPALARGYVEATIAGDLTEEAATRAVSRTLGALRARPEKKTTAAPPKPVRVTADAGFTRIEFVGEQNMGLVIGTWPVTGPLHVRDQAALEVLAKVLELRVRAEVREKLGLAYGPSVRFEPYDGFADFGLLRAQIDCAPNDAARVAPLVEAIGAELAARGAGEGEFIGARGILKGQLRLAFRENGFLANALMRAQERPEETAEIVALRMGMMDTVGIEEVNRWAAKTLKAENCRSAALVPKAFVGVFEGAR